MKKVIALTILSLIHVNTLATTIPVYIEQVAQSHGIKSSVLMPTGTFWPWLVWRGDVPIKLKDQLALIRYIKNDPTVKFGLYKLTVNDFPGGVSIAAITTPVNQTRLYASRLAKNNSYKKPDRSGKRLSGPYADLINKYAAQYDISPYLINAVIMAESAYQKEAVSNKGAAGLMQVMPATAEYLGYKPSEMYEPQKAIEAGTRYLAENLKRFGKIELALAAYNAGPGAVKKYKNTIPPYKETQNYVAKIMRKYRSYL